MATIETLSIQFNANGTPKAVENIMKMADAVEKFANSLKVLETSKLDAFSSALGNLKSNAPNKAQASNMKNFADAISQLAASINGSDFTSFSANMAAMGQGVQSMGSKGTKAVKNLATALSQAGQQAQNTSNTINNVTGKATGVKQVTPTEDQTKTLDTWVASLDRVKVKAEGVQGVLQKLGIKVPTKQFKSLEEQAEKIGVKYDTLREKIRESLTSGEYTTDSDKYKTKMAELEGLRNEYDRLIQKQKELAQSGDGLKINPSLTKAYQGMSQAVSGVKQAFNGVSSIAKTAEKAVGSFLSKITHIGSASRKAKRDTVSFTESIKKLGKEVTRVSKMLKLMITRMALRAVIKEVGDGFKSLALHSQEFDNNMSNLINSSKTLGYSISGMAGQLLNALAPVLLKIIQLVTMAVNALNQLFSALRGMTTWNKAKDFTGNWSDSIKAANKNAKELKKTVLGFDELNQLQDKKTSGGDTSGNITDMFEDVDIAPWAKDLSEKIKKIAKTLFDPIKKAWDNLGEYVKKSWKYAMDEVFKLLKSVGEDFLEVWQQEKTQKIFENILHIIGLIGVAIGNLASQFRIAWEKNETGKKILEAIRDIILIITEHIKNMAEATAKWAANLNFEPLLTSVQGWLESLKPVFDSIMGVIEDFYNEVVLKFTKWVVESGLPALIDVFKRFNEEVDWEGLREKLNKLWQHLEPFMETVGEGLIIFIERVTKKIAEFVNGEKFEKFLDHLEEWMDSIEPEDVADAIEKLVTALIALKIAGLAVAGLTTVAGIIKGIGTAIVGLGTAISTLGTFAAALTTVGKAVLIIVGIVVGGFALLKEPLLKLSEWLGGNKEKIDNIREAYSGFGGSLRLCKTTYLDLWYTVTGQKDKLEELHNQTITLTNAQGEATKVVDTWGDTIIDFTHDIDDMTKSTDDSTNVVTVYSNAVETASSVFPKLGDNIYDAESAEESFSKALGDLQGNLKDVENAQGSYKASLDKVKSASEINIDISDELGKTYEILKDDADKVTISLQDNQPAFQKAGDAAKEASGMVAEYVASSDDVIQIIPDVNTSMESMQTTMDDVSKSVGESAEAMRGEFSEDKWKLDGVDKGLSSTFENALKSIKEKFKSAFEWINDKLKLDVDGKTVNLGHVGGHTFAKGGFPEDGIFFANHNELVGGFSNGKTAVANNSQIISGIQSGVYSAVSQAMQNSGGGASYISNEILVDGEVIARTITKAQEKQNRRYSPQTV